MRADRFIGKTDRRGSGFSVGSRKGSSYGFTMIEMIGVLAVLAILATLIVSSTTGSLDLAAGNLETTNLVNYATALQNSILRNRKIPAANNVVPAIATELGMDIKDVNFNARKRQRAFVYQPDSTTWFSFYTNAVPVVTPGPLVKGWQGWSQGAGGAFNVPTGVQYGAGSNSPPKQSRLMIVSSLGTNLPDAVLSGMTDADPDTAANNFQRLWDASKDSNLRMVTPFTSWPGTYTDLTIQRIDLSTLFVHIILYNYNYPYTRQGQYTIDPDRPGATPPLPVPNGQFGVDTWFLKGTVLGLLKSQLLGSTLDSNQILNRDTSFAYVMDTWRSSINLGEGVDPKAAMFGNALWATAEAFQGSPYNTNAIAGVTPPLVVNRMQTFMSNYVVWTQTPLFPNNLTSQEYINAKNAQSNMINSLFYLAGASSIGPNPGLNFVPNGATNGPGQ